MQLLAADGDGKQHNPKCRMSKVMPQGWLPQNQVGWSSVRLKQVTSLGQSGIYWDTWGLGSSESLE